jgi:hypothetical protein
LLRKRSQQEKKTCGNLLRGQEKKELEQEPDQSGRGVEVPAATSQLIARRRLLERETKVEKRGTENASENCGCRRWVRRIA